jgi:nucleotide-binding universal stress UspA family protein
MMAMKRILVPIDFEEAADAAVVYGRNLAKAFGAELHVLHVMENQFLRLTFKSAAAVETGVANRVAERLTPDDRATLQAVAVVRMSDEPADEIVQYADQEDIDLIVMGTHGRSRLAHLLMGSVAEKVVGTAGCPVMTVRQPEREFVVPDAVEADRDRA